MRPPGPTPRVGPGGGYNLRPHAAATGSNSTGGGAAAAAAAAVAGNDSAGHGDAVAPTYPRSPHVKSSDRVLWDVIYSVRKSVFGFVAAPEVTVCRSLYSVWKHETRSRWRSMSRHVIC